MKKNGILHGNLSKVLGQMGHCDTIMICDAGMPVPRGVQLIDLALVKGVPEFLQVLEAVLIELKVEEGFIALEMEKASPQMRDRLDQMVGIEFVLRAIPHESLKMMSNDCKAVIRTGEFTPYANIILKSGVLF